MRGFHFKVTQIREIPCGRTVSDSFELTLSPCLAPFKARISSIFWISLVFMAFVLHALRLILGYIQLEGFFLITD